MYVFIEVQERIGGGYTLRQRIIETASVVAFCAVELYLIYSLIRLSYSTVLIAVVVFALIVSALASDLISGVVHWACDTWGSIDTPVFGQMFIRQFREHHVDPQEINRHDFVETNGTNAMLALLPLGLSCLQNIDPANPNPVSVALRVFAMGLALFTTLTSQAHSWAHAPSAPRFVRLLQRWRLLLSPEHHAVHHVWPHRHHYSITGGWVDYPLEKLRAFRAMEALIIRTTGAEMHTDSPDENLKEAC